MEYPLCKNGKSAWSKWKIGPEVMKNPFSKNEKSAH
jgi:hypothetical protein